MTIDLLALNHPYYRRAHEAQYQAMRAQLRYAMIDSGGDLSTMNSL